MLNIVTIQTITRQFNTSFCFKYAVKINNFLGGQMISNNYNYNYNLNFGQKYRVILTKKCPRQCLDCINTFDPVISKAKKIKLDQIKSSGDDIILTGGEPGIYPYLEEVVEKLRGQNPDAKMFIYSALANKKIIDILPKVDGLSFTLHDDASELDIASFLKLQKRMKELKTQYPEKSYRLYIDSRLEKEFPIEENLYTRVNKIKWMNEEEILAQKDRNFGCPADEELVLLDNTSLEK